MRRGPLRWLAALGERGNVALMTAIFAPLLLLVGGFAVDYGYASYLNQRLAQATDNAVLASVSQSAATAGGGFGNTAWLQQYGEQVFANNIAGLPITGVKFTLQVTPNGSLGVNSQGSYSYDHPTFFAGVLGIDKISMGSQIKASANPITYIDVYVVIDISQSMGVAATPDDMQKLYDRVVAYGNGSGGEAGCVFGCHVKAPEQTGTYTNEQLAHVIYPKINLRIDAAITAIQSIVSNAQSKAGVNKNIRIGIYTMSRDPNKPGVFINPVSAPSADYSTLMMQAAAIELGGNIPKGAGDTDFSSQMSSFANVLPAVNGSGASTISPKNYVFFVTDGLSDASVGCDPGIVNCHPTKAFVASDCATTKAKVTAMGVIYTTYNPIYNQNNPSLGEEGNYHNLVAPYVNAIPTNLFNCSSQNAFGEQWYFEAKDGPSIDTAMRTLFASTLQNARLTQ